MFLISKILSFLELFLVISSIMSNEIELSPFNGSEFFFFIFRIYFVVRLRRLCTYNVLNCTYGRPLRKIHERGPRCPEVRPRPPPMNEDGRRTAPMTMRDEPASGSAEVGGLDKLNGGE